MRVKLLPVMCGLAAGSLAAAMPVGMSMLVARQLREGRLRASNLVGASLLLGVTSSVPLLVMHGALEPGGRRGAAGIRGGNVPAIAQSADGGGEAGAAGDILDRTWGRTRAGGERGGAG